MGTAELDGTADEKIVCESREKVRECSVSGVASFVLCFPRAAGCVVEAREDRR